MKVASYRETRIALFEEFSTYFSRYPLDVRDQLKQLDKWNQALDTPYPFERKALVYQAAAGCPVQIFRFSPFYFELKSGRIRNSSKNGFPPGPGLEGWYMSSHMGLAETFRRWSAPYKSQDLIWCDIFADFAHHTVGYESVLKEGFSGILKRIEASKSTVTDPKKLALLRAMETGAAAMGQIADNFAQRAEELLRTETDLSAMANLKAVAQAARNVPVQPAGTLYEAMCVILFLREVMTALEGVAIAVLGGQIDLLLQPYYEADLTAGRITQDEAKNLVDHFLTITDARWDMTCTFASTNNSITIGGVDEAGNVLWNDISRMILSSFQTWRFVNPKVQVRLTPDHPQEAFDLVAQLAADGINVVSVLNDPVIIASHVRMGKKLEDARRYAAGGCQEPVLDNEFNDRAFCYVNLPQLVNSFFDPELTKFFDIETPEFKLKETFSTFDELYLEFISRLRNLFLAITRKLNLFDQDLTLFNPCPLLSCTLKRCVERALDYTQGGCTYNASSIPLVGIGTAVNSLLAIREAVFEKKLATIPGLGEALKRNFEGYERLRGYLAHKCLKFGMDTPEVNAFARRLFHDVAHATSGEYNARGGLYEASLFAFYLFDWMKEATGATADGRCAGRSLSRGINPPDDSGYLNIANLLHTISNLDLADFPGCGVTYLEIPIAGDGITAQLIAFVIQAFLKSGGSALDLNLLDPQQLIDAKKHPEKYRNLIVRVCGFSAYFTSLSQNIQEEIIKRAFVSHE